MALLVWLASYPKSGNTWARALLANYRNDGPDPVDINNLGGLIASHREQFDEWLSVEASDLSAVEIARYRRRWYTLLAADAHEPVIMKVHDGFHDANGEALFTPGPEMRVICIVRHPCAVAVSLAHHAGWSVDRSIEAMRTGFRSSKMGDSLHDQLEQWVPPWSTHVSDWMSSMPSAIVIRYEDMIARPLDETRRLIGAVTGVVDENRLQRAVAFSSFAELQAQEARRGFVERPPSAPAFFRQGATDAWRRDLTDVQHEELIRDHGTMMARLGYAGDPRA